MSEFTPERIEALETLAKAAAHKERIRAQKEELWLARQAAEIVSKTRRKVKPSAEEWLDMARKAIDDFEVGNA